MQFGYLHLCITLGFLVIQTLSVRVTAVICALSLRLGSCLICIHMHLTIPIPCVSHLAIIFLMCYSYIAQHLLMQLPFQVSCTPPGAQACTFDITTFHCMCLVLPSHKPWLVVQGWPGSFYIDHSHPFGALSTCSNAGMIANAAVDIWVAEGVHSIYKYEDDLKIFHFPSSSGCYFEGNFQYDYDTAEALCCISSLGIPWHKDKCDSSFSFITTFIGYMWDLPNKLISLTEPKHNKFHQRVQQFLDRFEGHPKNPWISLPCSICLR